MRSKVLLLILSCLLLVGCGTALHGTTQQMQFNSNPQGAKVYLDGELKGNTPLTLKVSRSQVHNLRYELEGFKTFDSKIERNLDWFPWGVDVVSIPFTFGGSVLCDFAFGGWYLLEEKNQNPNLVK